MGWERRQNSQVKEAGGPPGLILIDLRLDRHGWMIQTAPKEGRDRQAPLALSCLLWPRGIRYSMGFSIPLSNEKKTTRSHQPWGVYETEGAPNNVGPLYALHRSQGRWRAAGELSPVGGSERLYSGCADWAQT